MNFREQLSAELSKRNADYMASVIGNSEELFGSTTNLMENNKLAAKKSNVFRAII